jgi:hypothetical protein
MTKTPPENGSPLSKLWFLQHALCDPHLGQASKIVLSQLIFHHNQKTAACFPSEQLLSNTLGMSIRTIKRSIQELRKQEWLKIEYRLKKGTNEYMSNQYFFDWDCPTNPNKKPNKLDGPGATSDPRVHGPSVTPGGVKDDQSHGPSLAPGGVTSGGCVYR